MEHKIYNIFLKDNGGTEIWVGEKSTILRYP